MDKGEEMSNILEALGGRADTDWLIEKVNDLYDEGHLQGELQEGLIFAIKGREDAEKELSQSKQALSCSLAREIGYKDLIDKIVEENTELKKNNP